jgi:hypothetical protein
MAAAVKLSGSLRVVAVIVFCTSVPAYANDETVGSVDVGYIWPTAVPPGADGTPGLVALRGGLDITRNLALEVLAATTARSPASESGYVQPGPLTIQQAFGIYFKGQLPLGRGFWAFLQAGALHSDLKATIGGGNVTADATTLSYGAGAQYFFTPRIYARADFMVFWNRGANPNAPPLTATGNFAGASLGIGVRF